MCANPTADPTVSPSEGHLPADVTVSVPLHSSSETTVTVKCQADPPLKGAGSDMKTFKGSTTISIPVHLESTSGSGAGIHNIAVSIEEPGCGSTSRGCTYTVPGTVSPK